MVYGAADFLIGNERYSQQIPEYTDTGTLIAYLAGKNENAEASFVCTAVEMMTELRYEAEKLYREKQTPAINRKGELLISIKTIADKWTDSEKKEPPQQLISVIANQHRQLIEMLISGMRKVLKRKRAQTGIAEVQQLDSQCLRWLARRPGRTAVEKAGSQQKLLAVVREETQDTLENRVLKDFVIRAELLAKRYLAQYESQFPKSERIKDVKRLKSILTLAIKMPEMQSLRRATAGVQPNYVLLHDARYNKLWELYRLILSHTRMTELVWRDRHRMFGELFCIWLSTRLHLQYDNIFDSSFWINTMPEYGSFLVNAIYTNVYQAKALLRLKASAQAIGSIEICAGNIKKAIHLLYVPESVEEALILPANNSIYVICCFSQDCRKNSLHSQNSIWLSSAEELDNVATKILNACGL